jgi:NAD(P)-dependent dehydrogenase (short-subunit alcohol dehydrogenase family)
VGFYYDLVKANVERIVKGLSAELENSPVTVVGVTPGWLRSEKMLDNFGVTEANWRDAVNNADLDFSAPTGFVVWRAQCKSLSS